MNVERFFEDRVRVHGALADAAPLAIVDRLPATSDRPAAPPPTTTTS